MSEGILFMITATETEYIRDIVYDLAALADPSEFLQEEVEAVYEILDNLNKTKLKETEL